MQPTRPNSSEKAAKTKSVVRSGNELQVRLRALHEALAVDAAGADGDHALQRVEALAERILDGSSSVQTRCFW